MARQTDQRHDDYKVQREFERLKKERASSTERETAATPDTTTPSSGRLPSAGEVLRYDVTSPDRTIVVRKNAGAGGVRFEISRPLSIALNDTIIPDSVGNTNRIRVIDFHTSNTVSFAVTGSVEGEVEITAIRPLTIARSWLQLTAEEESSDEVKLIWFDNDEQFKPTAKDQRVWFEFEEVDDKVIIYGYYQNTTTNNLTIENDGVAVGGSDTSIIDFDSNGQTSTDVAVKFEVFNDGSGQRRLRAYVPSAGAGYTAWNLEVNGSLREAINDSDDVDFIDGTGTTVGGSGRQISINIDASPFKQTNEQNSNEESYNFTPGDTVEFENATESKPGGHTSRVWIDIVKVGSVFTIEGWYEDSNTIYAGWNLEVNGVLREVIDSTDDVDFIDGIGTTVVGSGRQVAIDRPLQIKDDTVNVGDNATVAVNFDSNGQTSTDVAIRFDVIDDGAGQRSIRGYVPSAGAGYTAWNLEVNSVLREAINDSDDVDFVDGVGTTVGGSARTISIDVEATTWKQVNEENANEETGSYYPGDVIEFENETENKPGSYTQRVWFDLQMVAGTATIEGWVEDPTTAYYFTISVNGGATTQIDSTENIDFSGGNGTVEVTRTGNDLEFVSPLQLRQDGVDVGANDTVVIDFDNLVGTKPSGYTKQAWVDVVDDTLGVRRILIWYEDLTGITTYSWFLKGGNSDTGTEISDTEAVTIVGEGSVYVRRIGNTIIINSDGDDVSRPIDDDRRIKRGILDLWTDLLPEPGYFGVEVSATIDHDWDLDNMHGWHLRLETVQFDHTRDPATPGVLVYHWGDPYPTGLLGKLGDVATMSIPDAFATDANTVKVRATIPKLNGAEPTHLKYHYVLEEA